MDLVIGDDGVPRCWWGAEPEIYRDYHDGEWGRAVTDDNRLFEKICLEGFQAGLSWLTILRKRESFGPGSPDSILPLSPGLVRRTWNDCWPMPGSFATRARSARRSTMRAAPSN